MRLNKNIHWFFNNLKKLKVTIKTISVTNLCFYYQHIKECKYTDNYIKNDLVHLFH